MPIPASQAIPSPRRGMSSGRNSRMVGMRRLYRVYLSVIASSLRASQ
jgi:hypothetical protein